MTGRLHHVILDSTEPDTLAGFYSRILGWPVTYRSPHFTVVAPDETSSGLAFQLAPDHQPPRWPDPRYPQQIHFDVMVDDLDTAALAVVQLGAVAMGGDHVYADPAGHPFCLIRRPHWADPTQQNAPDSADTERRDAY